MEEQGKVTRKAAGKVTVGVCGGIAAYKAVELVRMLQDAGLDPHVVMTRAAEEFVRPLTFAAISGHKVITSLWGEEAGASAAGGAGEMGGAAGEHGRASVEHLRSSVEHIEEAQTTQALVVAPATADMLAKLAHGLADDFLTTLALATKAPLVLAPAMNVNMWEHPAVRANLATLRERGAVIVEPGSGYLACGMVGGGRLAEPAEIARAVLAVLDDGAYNGAAGLAEDYAGETVLVSAGGTREAVDAVRFLGNRSSGRMGYALAAAARRRGARVVLVTAPTALRAPSGCEVVAVESAAEMRAAMLRYLPEATTVVMAAAVSDYTVREVAAGKLKRAGPRVLELEPTADILREVVERRPAGTVVVGFAAEMENALENGRAKLLRKGVDALVVNDVSVRGLGFDSEHNAGVFLTAQAEMQLPPMTKSAMAERILDEVLRLREGLPAAAGRE